MPNLPETKKNKKLIIKKRIHKDNRSWKKRWKMENLTVKNLQKIKIWKNLWKKGSPTLKYSSENQDFRHLYLP